MFFLNSCLPCVLGQSLTGALGCMAPHPGCPVDLGGSNLCPYASMTSTLLTELSTQLHPFS